MRPLLTSFEIRLFWLPLLAVMIITILSGGQVHGSKDIPSYLSPASLCAGLVMIAGGIIGLAQPKALDHWFRLDADITWRDFSQFLFALVFGGFITYWSIGSFLRVWL
jgi:hypothetical protein